MSNIIHAIINLVNDPITELQEIYAKNNRVNHIGDALESYIIDLFANTLHTSNTTEKLEKISNTFSYLGNANNPPDAMLLNGDAIEVKKIENFTSALALNSSYPKQKLYSNSPMISKACKTAEEYWTEKDMLYITGVVDKKTKQLKYLSMVYGLDYCASSDVYENIKKKIKEGIASIPNLELTETTELGKLKKVDPLGITYLRMRSMWGIENPWSVFHDVYEQCENKNFNFMCIINHDKWNTFSNTNDLINLSKKNNNLTISDITIKNPDNPAKFRNAKLIEFSIEGETS